jgi:hypothetical protein
MSKTKPLTDDEGEVRELLAHDIRRFRPATEVLPPTLAAKLGIAVEAAPTAARARRKSGVPTGNAGEYLVMGELLRRGYDAQLADRNTKGYDLLVGRAHDRAFHPIQVKTVRIQPWYVNTKDFEAEFLEQVTVYVLLGSETSTRPARFFVAKNRELMAFVHQPPGWKQNGFIKISAVRDYEDRWETVLS